MQTMPAMCRSFIETVAVQSMMGSALALVQIPEHERKAFIDRWTTDAADMAMKLHEKIENRISAWELAQPDPVVPPTPERFGGDEQFYNFDQAMAALNIDERRLKRLVSEGEIRCFRDGEWMKFKKSEIDSLRRPR